MKLQEKIRSFDQFGHIVDISHKGQSFKTMTGGVLTLFMNLMFVMILIRNIDKMISFDSKITNYTETRADYDGIGKINLANNSNVPFYRFLHKGQFIK